MRQDERAPFDHALEEARRSAYPPGEFVGQESLMSASQILCLAARAGIAPGDEVLDLCCGVAGPGRLLTRETGCAYLGVDYSADAIEIARARSGDLDCRFEVRRVPPLPPGTFDVVLLLETVLAFPDKKAMLSEVSRALPAGGRFACTLEAGEPLTAEERRRMPDADTVWPVPLRDMLSMLEGVGLRVRWQAEWSDAHRVTAGSLAAAFAAQAGEMAARLGRRAVEDLLAAHRLWDVWLRVGRVRKFAVVAEKTGPA